jgi:hypothetical protein
MRVSCDGEDVFQSCFLSSVSEIRKLRLLCPPRYGLFQTFMFHSLGPSERTNRCWRNEVTNRICCLYLFLGSSSFKELASKLCYK